MTDEWENVRENFEEDLDMLQEKYKIKHGLRIKTISIEYLSEELEK